MTTHRTLLLDIVLVIAFVLCLLALFSIASEAVLDPGIDHDPFLTPVPVVEVTP